MNIKNGFNLPELVDSVVADLSFISLRLVLHAMMNLLKDNGVGIFLVKPQFEVGPQHIERGGIVKNQKVVYETIRELLHFISQLNFHVVDFCKCDLAGKDGNQEYFFLVNKTLPHADDNGKLRLRTKNTDTVYDISGNNKENSGMQVFSAFENAYGDGLYRNVFRNEMLIS